MQTRSIMTGAVTCGALVAVGTLLFLYGLTHAHNMYHGLRFLIGGATVAACGVTWGAVLALAWRTNTLTRVYREGYRQGRRDANAALFEEGCTVLGVLDPHDRGEACDD